MLPWDPGGVKHTFKNFFSSAWGQADFQGRRNVMTQATCGNVVGLCLGSSSEWASLWIRGSQQYIKTGHDREEHRTDSDIVFLLKTAFPLSLCCSWFLTLVHAIPCLISPILLQNCTQITYCTLAIVIWRWRFITESSSVAPALIPYDNSHAPATCFLHWQSGKKSKKGKNILCFRPWIVVSLCRC